MDDKTAIFIAFGIAAFGFCLLFFIITFSTYLEATAKLSDWKTVSATATGKTPVVRAHLYFDYKYGEKTFSGKERCCSMEMCSEPFPKQVEIKVNPVKPDENNLKECLQQIAKDYPPSFVGIALFAIACECALYINYKGYLKRKK